jgi:hypothetical protein
MIDDYKLKRSKAESILDKSPRTTAVYLTLLVWFVAFIVLIDINMPTIAKIILWLMSGLVFGLFLKVWHMSKRLEAAIFLLTLTNRVINRDENENR